MSDQLRYIYAVFGLLILGVIAAVAGGIALYLGAGNWAGGLTAAGLMAVIASLMAR